MVKKMKIIVNNEIEGERLDKAAALKSGISRGLIQDMINDGHVLVNGKGEKNKYILKLNDVIEIIKREPKSLELEAKDLNIEIVYEDDDVAVVYKPEGMVVHPANGNNEGTLVNGLLYEMDINDTINDVKRPGIVHRIDKDTSGLLVVAKNDTAHKNLCEQFARHSIERTYYALVFGVPNPTNSRIETLIGRSPYDRKKMAIVKKNGKNAITNYKTLEVFKSLASLVQCNLETGRTHQIRVHMSSLGCNLIGDQLYEKNKKINAKGVNESARLYINNFPRQALHALSLGFIHPKTKKTLQFSSELPLDFKELMDNLRNL